MFYSQDGWKVVYTQVSCPRLFLIYCCFFTFYFYSCLSDILTLFASFDFQKLAHVWRWRFPISSRGRSQFDFFVFILDRISPRRNCCEIMEQRDASLPTSTPQRGFFSVKSVKYFWKRSFFGDDSLHCFVYILAEGRHYLTWPILPYAREISAFSDEEAVLNK